MLSRISTDLRPWLRLIVYSLFRVKWWSKQRALALMYTVFPTTSQSSPMAWPLSMGLNLSKSFGCCLALFSLGLYGLYGLRLLLTLIIYNSPTSIWFPLPVYWLVSGPTAIPIHASPTRSLDLALLDAFSIAFRCSDAAFDTLGPSVHLYLMVDKTKTSATLWPRCTIATPSKCVTLLKRSPTA